MALIQSIYVAVPTWASGTYAAGAVVVNGTNGYVTPNGGTSTAGPTGTGNNIAPGGAATWNYISAVDYRGSNASALQAWADGLPATLTQTYIGEIVVGLGQSVTTTTGTAVLTLSGHTTAASKAIILRPKPGFGFATKLQGSSSPLAFNAANGVAIVLPSSGVGGINYITVNDDWVSFDGLQFQDPNSGSGSTIIQAGANFSLLNSIVDGYSQDGGAWPLDGSLTGASSSVFTIINCLIVDRGTTGNYATTLTVNYNTKITSTTFHAINAPTNQLGFHCTGGAGTTFTVLDSIFLGYAHDNNVGSDTGATGTVSYSLTDAAAFDATGVTTGAGNLYSKTAANQFVSATSNWRLKYTADAANAGTSSTFTTDILGTTRPQGPAWDIGPYEIPSVSAVGSASGAASVSGVGRSVSVAVGTASGSSTVVGVGPVASTRTVTAGGTSTVTGVGRATSAGTGSAAGHATVMGSNFTGSIGASIDLAPIPPQPALTPFTVTGSLTLQPQLQFSVDASPSFQNVPSSGVSSLGAVQFQFTHPGAGLGSHVLTIQDLTTGAATSEGFTVNLIGGAARVFPPTGPTSLQTIIPSYLYQEYFDDDDLQAFVEAQNSLAQGYLDWFNSINLPIYTSPTIAGPLLDWVGAGLYGYPRPTLAFSNLRGYGQFNTWVINTLAFNAGGATGTSTVLEVTDEIYKRLLTWHFYKGDGRQFTIRWLKRRVGRFLSGTSGTAGKIDDLSQISVSFASGTPRAVNLTISNGALDTTYAPILQAAILTGVLEMPFAYTCNVLIQ